MLNWDDLRFVLAIARGDTLSAAARRLRVDQTTVARRLTALEAAAGKKLFLRVKGRFVPTEAGAAMLARAQRVETEIARLEAEVSGADTNPEGTVRLTAVPVLANHLLVPRLASLLARHPKLRIEMIAEPRNLSLRERDADIAVRLARPESGSALCRRLGQLSYSVYGTADHSPDDLPWIVYERAHAHLPQARWLAKLGPPAEAAQIRVNDAEALLAAVLAGLGRTLLPDLVMAGEDRVERLSPDAVLSRAVWLLVHPDLRHLPRISVVIDWLDAIFGRLE